MGLFDKAKEYAATTALQGLLPVISPAVERYGVLHYLRVENGTLRLGMGLHGLEQEFHITVGSVRLSDDGECVTLGDFHANMPFLENALNDFAHRPIPLRGGPAVKTALKALCAALG